MFLRKKNKIIIHKLNGKQQTVRTIRGLSIKFKGENSVVEVWEPCRFKKSKIRIDGNNNIIQIKSTKHNIYGLKIIGIKDNNKVIIGKNLFTTGCKIEFTQLSGLDVNIGNECMIGKNTNLMLGDFHKIYDITTKTQINIPKKGITIGNHVWLARDVTILKDVSIAGNTIAAMGSLITRSFNDENILIGGIPAKVLKNNVTWEI